MARDFTAWIRKCNQIKSRDGFSAAAAAGGPARRVAETDDAAIIDDFQMQRLSVEYWVESAVIQADACVVEEG